MGKSLRLRYYGAFALMLAAFTAFYFLFWAPRLSYHFEQIQKEAMVAALEGMGRKVAIQAKAGNHDALRVELKDMLVLYPTMVEARFTMTNGRVLQEPDRAGAREATSGQRKFTQQVSLQGVLYGSLEASVDYARQTRYFSGQLGSLFAVLMLGLVVTVMLASLFIERYVGRPLERLASAARAIAHDGHHVKIPRGMRGAPGLIAHSLARMRDSLSSNGREIETQTRRIDACELRMQDARACLAAAPADGIWEWDLGGDKIHASTQAEALLGLDAHGGASSSIAGGPLFNAMLGLAGRNPGSGLAAWRERILPEDREAFDQAMQACKRGEQEDIGVEVRVRQPGDAHGWLSIRGHARLAEGGQPARVVGVVTDIAARKSLERILQAPPEGMAELTAPTRGN
jgi:PAS domain-containing protein